MKLQTVPLLSITGVFLLVAMALSSPTRAQEETSALGPVGTVWGGEHVRLEVMEKGATLEFDCASGAFAGPFVTNDQGNFRVTGIFTVERGGPVSKDDSSNAAPATYSGIITGGTMKLSITAGPQNETVGVLGEYVLARGSRGHVVKCR